MEPFYGFDCEVDLGRAGDQRRIVEIALEIGRLDDVTAESELPCRATTTTTVNRRSNCATGWRDCGVA